MLTNLTIKVLEEPSLLVLATAALHMYALIFLCGFSFSLLAYTTRSHVRDSERERSWYENQQVRQTTAPPRLYALTFLWWFLFSPLTSKIRSHDKDSAREIIMMRELAKEMRKKETMMRSWDWGGKAMWERRERTNFRWVREEGDRN